jgi:hypothetical protein
VHRVEEGDVVAAERQLDEEAERHGSSDHDPKSFGAAGR